MRPEDRVAFGDKRWILGLVGLTCAVLLILEAVATVAEWSAFGGFLQGEPTRPLHAVSDTVGAAFFVILSFAGGMIVLGASRQTWRHQRGLLKVIAWMCLASTALAALIVLSHEGVNLIRSVFLGGTP